MAFNIGWFSSGDDPRDQELLIGTLEAIRDFDLEINISYLFCNYQMGENKTTDRLLETAKKKGLEVITLAEAEVPKKDKGEGPAEKNESEWLDEYSQRALAKISQYPIDLALLVNYSPGVSFKFINTYTTALFRPALPDGPSGDRSNIIWQLIGTRAIESGVSLHLLNEDNPERGITLTYCSYPIKGKDLYSQWLDYDRQIKAASLQQIIEKQGEKNSLFQAIKENGEQWEQPLLTLSLFYLSTGKMKLKGQDVFLYNHFQPQGCDLSEEIIDEFFSEK